MTIKPPISTENILTEYNLLPPFAKIVLQLCSVIYGPADVSALLKCLYESKVKINIARHEYAREILPALHLLKKCNLINSSHQCSEAVVEIISRQAVADQNFTPMSLTVQTVLPSPKDTGKNSSNQTRLAIRNLRIDLYCADFDNFHKNFINYHQTVKSGINPIVTICNNPFTPEWIADLPDHIQFLAIHEILKSSICRLKPITPIVNYLEQGFDNRPPPISRHSSFLYLFISSLLLQGRLHKATECIHQNSGLLSSFGFEGWLLFIKGNYEQALELFEKDLVALRKINNNNKAFFTGFEGLIYFLLLLKTEAPLHFPALREIYNSVKSLQPDNVLIFSYHLLNSVLSCQESGSEYISISPKSYNVTELSSIDSLFLGLGNYWIEGRLDPGLQQNLTENFKLAAANDYQWLTREFAEILYRTTRQTCYLDLIEEYAANEETTPLLCAIHHEEPWRKAINKLKEIAANNGSEIPFCHARLCWFVRINQKTSSISAITPREQRLSENGHWSAGRRIALNKLCQVPSLPFMTEQDNSICSVLTGRESDNNTFTYLPDLDHAIAEMTDHPLVFREDSPGIRINVIQESPKLHVKNCGQNVTIIFSPHPPQDKDIVLNIDSPNRISVYKINTTHHRIASIVGKFGLHVPLTEKEQILHLIGSISSHLNIHSDLDGSTANVVETVPDNKINCRLSPTEGGFRVELLIKPFKNSGHYFKPGNGARTIIAEINGKSRQVTRNLNEEEKNALAVERSCPSLHGLAVDEWEWHIHDLSVCLQVLEELKAVHKTVVIEWPQGEILRLNHRAASDQLYLKINRRNNWFELDGQLKVDDNTVLNMQELLKLVRNSDSRFVPMSDGQFLSLSKELYQQLDLINGITESEENNLKVTPFAAPILIDLTQNLDHFEPDQHWRALEEKSNNADQHVPKLPSTLQASLRSYQAEGFFWLSRLAYLGFGACLADEMGLGKTIQALTLILDQAKHGPALVVAPTSVCFNWIDEARRFTPTLKVSMLGGQNRQKTIRKLGSFDLLITSYGLLQQEQELLAERCWQVIVLDEAQAIKNMATKRSHAAMSLKAQFKIITTGTPLENNLGELWNLFRFINPGLLGSISQFNKRYAAPISKDSSLRSQKRLKQLINPFILRRLKSQVLDELPPRTEINLLVNLSEEETALYEALRRDALTLLSNTEKKNKNFQILAQIMRLRRLCCNPSLININNSVKSSKLALFEELIDELLTNQHKVLVFSQFVDHLSIIRGLLERKNISYQYLDGSVPARKRKTIVERFQGGEGEIFLISLKAGGLGINLTAANYVIHMDPWWNPAVEDQASDRVHRIGQKQPVTIYRLITHNTIEEKIVALHREKRELADRLLEGTEVSNKISAADLLQLLKDN